MNRLVFAQLETYLNRTFTLPTTYLTPSQQLQADLGLNEWEFLEVIAHLETVFGLTLPDEELTPTLRVGQLCALIYRHSLQPENFYVDRHATKTAA